MLKKSLTVVLSLQQHVKGALSSFTTSWQVKERNVSAAECERNSLTPCIMSKQEEKVEYILQQECQRPGLPPYHTVAEVFKQAGYGVVGNN